MTPKTSRKERITKLRNALFISKATPGDDEFVLWLAPRLEAAGYTVFADILNLEPGDRWRKHVTAALQERAVKMLLCCKDSTLSKNGVQEEIGLAEDIAKELGDPHFIIPLRLESFKKVFGIGELQHVDFVGSWANGLRRLLEALKKEKIPTDLGQPTINPNWENYKKRWETKVLRVPEILTSNWLRILRVPDTLKYYQAPGAINHTLMERTCRTARYPTEVHNRGFFSFASAADIEDIFSSVGTFALHSEHKLSDLLEHGSNTPSIRPREAQSLVSSMYRKAWETFCREKGLFEYTFSLQSAFYFSEEQVALGRKISWGQNKSRRSSMLRNSSGGKVWQYGVSAAPHHWPFPHFRLKARVVFAELSSGRTGSTIEDPKLQHRLRRTVCKGWRNKAWHGRMMAFLELLSETTPHIDLPLASSCSLRLDSSPVLFTAPATSSLRDTMEDDADESDSTTLGAFESDELE